MESLDASSMWSTFRAPLRAFIARRVPATVDVDDVLQDVFLRAHRGAGALRDEERLDAWLFQISRNAITDALRSQGSRERMSSALAVEEDVAAMIDGAAADDEARGMLLRCLRPMMEALDEPYREALALVDLDGLTHAEAAARVGISLSGMKSRVQRGRKQLRAIIEDCCAVELDARNGVVGVAPRCRDC